MKYDHRKSFGYPVQRPLDASEGREALDYPGATLQVTFEPARLVLDGEQQYICFECTVKTSAWALKQAVQEKKAGQFLRIDCPDTYFRLTEPFEGQQGKVRVPAAALRGKVEFSTFIAATSGATIVSDQIHPDFEMQDGFAVKAGNVLAVHWPYEYWVEKEAFRSITAVFDYWPRDEVPDNEFRIVLGDDVDDIVRVVACPAQIRRFKLAEKRPEQAAVLINSVMMTGVVQMVQAMNDPEQRKLYEHTRWARALLAKHNEWGEKIDPVVVAQKLLKAPLGRLNKRIFTSS